MSKVMKTPRLFNKYKDKVPPDAIYIGRPSVWGNPYQIGRDGNRAMVVYKHREMVLSDPELQAKIRAELRGKDLVCFCAPAACHGQILMEIANSPRTGARAR